MFKNFLIKEHKFWSSHQDNILLKHSESFGGIYALLNLNSVTIIFNQARYYFNSFKKLDKFLNQIKEDTLFKRILRNI